jgi:uncharacterized YigZ family protein
MSKDSYHTIHKDSEGLYREKGSKFIARVFHVGSASECKQKLINLKKEYHSARHHCYAYRLGPENLVERSHDDGEPAGSAGRPILNQILSFDLYNVMVVVIRYFGGTKLGKSGLVNAYKTAARDGIGNANIVKKHSMRELHLQFDYTLIHEVMTLLKTEETEIILQDFAERCKMKVGVRKSEAPRLISKLENIPGLTVKSL